MNKYLRQESSWGPHFTSENQKRKELSPFLCSYLIGVKIKAPLWSYETRFSTSFYRLTYIQTYIHTYLNTNKLTSTSANLRVYIFLSLILLSSCFYLKPSLTRSAICTNILTYIRVRSNKCRPFRIG